MNPQSLMRARCPNSGAYSYVRMHSLLVAAAQALFVHRSTTEEKAQEGEIMSTRDIHVFHEIAGWALYVEGQRDAISHYTTQQKAVAAGTAKAQREHVDIFVHPCHERRGTWIRHIHDLRDTD
ncbi:MULTISPECIES: DUF2188 domain-containing protein [Cupriavidus]|nr:MULTISPECIES: DUF2188 domain-containing protein [Cupriavidus]MCO4865606.1 DUF2188 domain-containing protein [Cupriavidus sp. WGlv3]MCO4893326.1 DUF2188 domain-containing protein [Cupriavidus sp. WGtm5]SOZ07084.1 hypothetical protein CBM2599_P380046 [Cupriavidus taiwanensis]SOZ76686.1 hypothetical protein CBM2617_P400047 [Cupriavidus taiwanensis]